MLRIILCKYKNGLGGEITELKTHRQGGFSGYIRSIPLDNPSIMLNHELNGICNSVEMDTVYNEIFLPDYVFGNILDYELTEIIIIKFKTVCKLQILGKSNIFTEKISKKNREIVEKYLKFKNVNIKTTLDNFRQLHHTKFNCINYRFNDTTEH